MNTEQARFNMIEQQIRPWEVSDPAVFDLLRLVRREAFVPASCRALAFADTEIPLGHGAAMLAPKIEAHALQALGIGRHGKILEVGAGSGYMAALLAVHADHVWTVEIDPALAEVARANLASAGVMNVTVETGDGTAGLPEHAPYDAIMVSGGLPVVPEALLAQLKVGGRLFAIVGQGPAMVARRIVRVSEDGYESRGLFETVAPSMRHAAAAERFAF